MWVRAARAARLPPSLPLALLLLSDEALAYDLGFGKGFRGQESSDSKDLTSRVGVGKDIRLGHREETSCARDPGGSTFAISYWYTQ
ncbi:hypothetical protein IE81DRAFT_321672 [Ceraceosorus guamensis]|uniref:Uncharacterized protein n=1 Tax=Ceraceosorus guamensis TaxID=1522189 RepID=A0A316W2V0_9BASI|nr:hypothetical protein IE81DRAFT_321672 [Ceraceosorus guamensis]PWN44019.1 hypothetical protein IE81DRAFT_321672 [Ceraceosorus guamensis]